MAPGPGLVVIALALAVYAVEYEWTRRHLAAVVAVRTRPRIRRPPAVSRRPAPSCLALEPSAWAVLTFTDVLPLPGARTGAGVAAAGVTVLATVAYAVWELRRAEKAHKDNSSG